MSTIHLNPSEARVLACLIEKRMSTPGNYPLTLNSLVSACNQSSNRDPVVKYDQHIINDALVATRKQGLSLRLSKSGSRTAKFDEQLTETLNLSDSAAAILAELMLRGPQTPGELRQRTTRMKDFPELDALESVLDKMSTGDTPLVVKLPKQPGKREARYAHLLCGPVDMESEESAPVADASGSSSLQERVSELEEQVATLSQRLKRLEAILD